MWRLVLQLNGYSLRLSFFSVLSLTVTRTLTRTRYLSYVLATADPPTGAVDITFVDLPDPLPESDHTNDDANATDDENVTGFPPVDDLTDGARGWRAGFAATACAVAIVF